MVEGTAGDDMNDLARDKATMPKVIDLILEPWVVAVTQKAQSEWKVEGSGKPEVVVGIRNNGRIARLVNVQPNGNEAFDNSVHNACMPAESYTAGRILRRTQFW